MNIREINKIEAKGLSVPAARQETRLVMQETRLVMIDKPDNKIVFRVIIATEPAGDFYHASCPAFPDLSVYGDTEEMAVSKAESAVKLFLELMMEHNDPIPIGFLL